MFKEKFTILATNIVLYGSLVAFGLAAGVQVAIPCSIL
jgi:hypothetical protein